MMFTDVRLKESLPVLTERIVDTYAEVGSISHLGHCPLPNYETVIAATEDLKEILYPGYRRRDGLHLGNVTYHVGDLIDRLHDTLTLQIGRAIRHEAVEERRSAIPQQARDFEALGQAKAVAVPRTIARPAQDSGHGRAGGLRRRSGLQVAGRSDLLLSRPGGHHDLPPGPPPARAGRAADSADDDRMGPSAARASTSIPAPRSAAISSSTTARAW